MTLIESLSIELHEDGEIWLKLICIYRVFYKCLKINSKFKLAVFLSYTMETKYFSERVTSSSFSAKKSSSGQLYTKPSLLKRAKRWGTCRTCWSQLLLRDAVIQFCA